MIKRKKADQVLKLYSIFVLSVLVSGSLAACGAWFSPEPTAVPTATYTPEPLLPTRTSLPATPAIETTVLPTMSPTATTIHEVVPSPTSLPATPTPTRTERSAKPQDFVRFGVTGDFDSAQMALEQGLLFAHFLNWNVEPYPPTNDFSYWQMIRLNEEGIRRTSWEHIELAITQNPGSYWMVGNEPDVIWQDNVTPERYAELYHEIYHFIKERDLEAKLVIGGVAQPTPLRRAYLDIVLDTYESTYGQPMPIDVWNVHAFILREEADSWGVDIPPGMEGHEGILYEIEDHNNIDILRQNLIEFRAWMAERGYRDTPLVISEFGILMPEDYGFPTEVLGEYMLESFALFLNEANETGYPADDNRLVQWWFWYILYEEDYYPYGKLVEFPEGKLTPLGEIWKTYIQTLVNSR